MPQRIVACQGPIQLVTAVTVLRQRERDLPAEARAAGWEDHLIITELAAPAGQEEAFVSALRSMAAALRPWKSMIHMQEPHDLTRFADVREVFVVREWQRSNQVLLAAFPAATKICFGDSIGIYLAPTHMAPARSLVRRLAALLRPTPAQPPATAPDYYYLTLADAFDPVPSRNVKATDPALLREVVDDLAPLVARPLLAELRGRLGQRRLVVLVTSNFSEQGVMSLETEVSAYMEYLSEQGFERDALILLKPHPRDWREKAMTIESALRSRFDNVFTLTDAVAAYLPLEALVLELRRSQALRIDLCTFSSACLASKYVLGVQPRIGFGARMVKQYFRQPFIKPRIRHESKLLKACAG